MKIWKSRIKKFIRLNPILVSLNPILEDSLNPILARDGSLQLSLVILIKEFTKRIFSDLHQ